MNKKPMSAKKSAKVKKVAKAQTEKIMRPKMPGRNKSKIQIKNKPQKKLNDKPKEDFTENLSIEAAEIVEDKTNQISQSQEGINTLVIYDSAFGNTKKIAELISSELGKDAKAVLVTEAVKEEVVKAKMLIVGSPINGWRPTEKMSAFLNSFSSGELLGIKAASFDTRVKLFIHGDATKKISKKLKSAGAEIISQPKFFFVKGTNGPLLDGEEQKAVEWAKSFKIQ